jgi:hypothetical protein
MIIAVHLKKHIMPFPEKRASPERVISIWSRRSSRVMFPRMLLPFLDGIQHLFSTRICSWSQYPRYTWLTVSPLCYNLKKPYLGGKCATSGRIPKSLGENLDTTSEDVVHRRNL